MEKNDANTDTQPGLDTQGQTGLYQQGPCGQLPPGYVMDSATGQVFYTGPVMGQQGFMQPGVAYAQPAPENTSEQTVPTGADYSQVLKSVEAFAEGEASVADVVKNLYATTAQDDQFWKGAIVGAAAAVLLTNESVRSTMGKTISSLFPGAKETKKEDLNASSKSGKTKKQKKTDQSKS